MRYLIMILVSSILICVSEYIIKKEYNNELEWLNKTKKTRILGVFLITCFVVYKIENTGILIAYSSLIVLLCYLSVIDYKTKYVDNKLYVLLLIISIISLIVNNNVHIGDKLITGVLTFSLLWFISKISKEAIGKGDAMILGALGFVFGVRGVITLLLVASFLVGGYAVVLLLKKSQTKEIPFIPHITVSLILLVFISNI